jgi:hypothetical protein
LWIEGEILQVHFNIAGRARVQSLPLSLPGCIPDPRSTSARAGQPAAVRRQIRTSNFGFVAEGFQLLALALVPQIAPLDPAQVGLAGSWNLPAQGAQGLAQVTPSQSVVGNVHICGISMLAGPQLIRLGEALRLKRLLFVRFGARPLVAGLDG